MPSKALFSKSSRLKTRQPMEAALPLRIADLGDCELLADCEGCGRQVRLYPGHADFDSRVRLASLLHRLACVARHRGKACGGLPRRLVLVREECRWVLDSSGEWTADDSACWEPADFEALAQPSRVQPAF